MPVADLPPGGKAAYAIQPDERQSSDATESVAQGRGVPITGSARKGELLKRW